MQEIGRDVVVGCWQSSIRARGDYRQIAHAFENVTARYREAAGDRILVDLMGQVVRQASAVAEHLDNVAGQLIALVGDDLDETEHDTPRRGISLVADLNDAVAAWPILAWESRARENDVVRLSGRLSGPEFHGNAGPHQVARKAWSEAATLRCDADLVTNRLRMYVSA